MRVYFEAGIRTLTDFLKSSKFEKLVQIVHSVAVRVVDMCKV